MSDELSEKLEVLQNEKTHLQNEKTHLQNEKTNLQNEKTNLQNEKTHLQNELAGHAATVLYLKKDLDYSVAANRSLRKKLIELEMASLSPVASSQSSLPHLIAENPTPSGFIDPRDDQDVNTELYLHLPGGRVENHFGKTTLGISGWNSNPDPIIGILVHKENDALGHTATEAGRDIQKKRQNLRLFFSRELRAQKETILAINI
ncbi:unnamed protein product [Timema podura]|uniref:Uncharacterized protein n=1 Tax=Timema podura TaxID=61482 RepID=A0ABN7NN69_TIMPD|nr:unnamed protein product [Timema podura]